MDAESSSAYEFRVRCAGETDSPLIRELIRDAGINPTGLDWRRFSLAVDEHGAVIGCGQIKPHGDGSDELASIAVVPAWQRRGVATALIRYLLANHPDTIYLTCRRRLGKFYERFGFTAASKDSLPPYFRRVSRASNALERFHILPEGIIVMKRVGGS